MTNIYQRVTMNNPAGLVAQQHADGSWQVTYSGFVEYGMTEAIALERLARELRFAADCVARISRRPTPQTVAYQSLNCDACRQSLAHNGGVLCNDHRSKP